jgi:shikimate kinase
MGDIRGLVLVGYRASGKTTLLRLLERVWRWPAFDLDAEIVARAGRPVPAIFSEEGEAGFRDREEALLAELLERPGPIAIATGGGCVEREANRRRLLACRHLVCYLEAPAAFLAERLAADAGDRPSLSGAPVDQEVAAILARREPWYREVAGVTLDPRSEAPAMLQVLAGILPR